MIFENVAGHFDIKKRLETSIKNNKVSHAYIFSGKRGVGKTTLALSFADVLTGKNGVDVTVVTNELYDVKSKTDAVSVDAIRSACADMYVKPYSAEKRVFIIPNAEKMTPQAQNALLKVFEEPPLYCVIILITKNDNMLLQTIRSRAVTYRFDRLSDREVEDYLKSAGINVSYALVRLASGSIGMALDLNGDDEISEILDNFIGLFSKIGDGSYENMYEITEYFRSKKSYCDVLFDVSLIMLSDTLKCVDSDLVIKNLSYKKSVKIIQMIENTRNSFSFNANYDLAISEMMLNIMGAING